MVSKGTLAFVAGMFVLLAAAFLAETAALIYEYWGYELGGAPAWFTLALFDSQNFLFFPTAGIAALFAFWRPTKVAVDAYARGRVRLGRFILPLGLIVCAGAAWGLADLLGGGPNRSLYEVAPQLLAEDRGEPGVRAPSVGGVAPEGAAVWRVPPRAPVSQVLAEVRQRSSKAGLSDFVDTCGVDEQLFVRDADDEKYCFVAGEYLTVAQCCEAKNRFRVAINQLNAEGASQLSDVHRWVMPVKIFFLLILVGVGVMLVRQRKAIRAHYSEEVDRFAFVLLLGGALMLLWPLLNSAYTLSYDVVYGHGHDSASGAYRSAADLYTLAFGVWALMLVFYQLRSYPAQFEAMAKMGSLIGAAVGVLSYQMIVDALNRTAGIGASVASLGVWGVTIVLLMIVFASRVGETFVSTPESDGGDDSPPLVHS